MELRDAVRELPGNRVLVAPLDWGLGHATRCVAVVRELQRCGYTPVLAASGGAYSFFQKEFPDLQLIDFPGLCVRYSYGTSQVWAMLRQMPAILRGIYNEHKALRDIVRQKNIDVVISDNRFGLWCGDCHSIYITHQLMIKAPSGLKLFEPLMWLAHRWFINRYDCCWIPDYEDIERSLAGDLTHKYPLPRRARFVGALSRFENRRVEWSEIANEAEVLDLSERYGVMVVVSGPEPHRTMMCDWALKEYGGIAGGVLLLCGKPADGVVVERRGNAVVVNHLPSNLMHYYLQSSEMLVCRSGYSTIMDLSVLRRTTPTRFIPTPGQTEQEYLCQIRKVTDKM